MLFGLGGFMDDLAAGELIEGAGDGGWASLLLGPALWGRFVEIFATLPGAEGRRADVQHHGILLYYANGMVDWWERSKEDWRGTINVTSELSDFSQQLDQLLETIGALSPEADEMLESCAKLYGPKLTMCYGHLAGLQRLARAAASQAKQDPGRRERHNPKLQRAEAVADAALSAYEDLTGIEVNTNFKGKRESAAFLPFLKQIYDAFGIRAGVESQAKKAVRRRNAGKISSLQNPPL